MAKKKGIQSIKAVDWSKAKQKFKSYTTTTGISVKLKAIPMKLLDKVSDSVKDPVPPVYTMEVFGGDTQEDVLTEEIVKGFETSQPEVGKMYREQYNDYTNKLSAAESERTTKINKLIMMRGIEFDIANEQEWVEEMAFMEIPIPDGKMARRYFYLDNEVMANPRDMAAIFDGVMSISGVPKEALADARESFRDLLDDEEGEENTPEGSAE